MAFGLDRAQSHDKHRHTNKATVSEAEDFKINGESCEALRQSNGHTAFV